MIARRIIAHVLNKIIIIIPSLLLLGAIALVIAPNYFIFGKDDSGWFMVYLYKYLIFLPGVFLDLFQDSANYLLIIQIILPTLMSLVFIDIVIISLIKADIGMKIMGLRIVSMKGKELSLIQIIIRTIIKYFSLTFFPFLLLYIFFNKEKKSLHDKISSTKVVKIQK